MILAAGRGERMRPLTDTLPKPLIVVGGRSLLDRALDRLVEHGVSNVVVNVHHLGEQIAAAPRGARPASSYEERLLETGGGVKNALPSAGRRAVLRPERRRPVARRPRADAGAPGSRRWDAERMDALLLLHPHRQGDRPRAEAIAATISSTPTAGRAIAARPTLAPYLFASVSICDRRLFQNAPTGAFSLLRLWNRAEAAGRLSGLVHDGEWFHVGTPQAAARKPSGC